MRRGGPGCSRAQWGLLLAAVAALLAHVCDAAAGTGHAQPGHHGPADASAAQPDESSDVHAASCDGVKPTPTGHFVSTAQSRPLVIVGLEAASGRDPLPALPLAIRRPALFVLHAAFLI